MTDLCFNWVDGKGFGYWVVFHAFGAYRQFAVSRMFAKMVKDRSAALESFEQILSADFDNIIMAHGAPVVGNGKQLLADALRQRGLI